MGSFQPSEATRHPPRHSSKNLGVLGDLHSGPILDCGVIEGSLQSMHQQVGCVHVLGIAEQLLLACKHKSGRQDCGGTFWGLQAFKVGAVPIMVGNGSWSWRKECVCEGTHKYLPDTPMRCPGKDERCLGCPGCPTLVGRVRAGELLLASV